MNSNDIYLSENTQLVNENNSEWIANTVFVETNDVVWNEGVPEITVDYSETMADQSTVDDDYLTAEESGDTTQYFSILETDYNDASNVQQTNENDDYNNAVVDSNSGYAMKIAAPRGDSILPHRTVNNLDDNESFERQDDDSVVVFRDEETEDYYAVQLVDDGTGKLKRVQHKVRQLEDGQFEVVPDSTPLQLSDDESELESNLSILAACSVKTELNVPEDEFEHVTADSIPHSALLSKFQNSSEELESDETPSDDGEIEYLISEDDDDEIRNLFLNGSEHTHYAEEITSDSEDLNSDVLLLRQKIEMKARTSRKTLNIIPKYNQSKSQTSKLNENKTQAVQRLTVKNPRSLLKSSYIIDEPEAEQRNKNGKENSLAEYEKFLQSSKEIQIKTARQPRKQTIKPVDRDDSEIIVKPMFFTTDGQMIEDVANKPNFPAPDEVLQVSDDSSDIDSDSEMQDVSKKKDCGRPNLDIAEITISDSDDKSSDSSVIEIFGETHLDKQPNENDSIVTLDDSDKETTSPKQTTNETSDNNKTDNEILKKNEASQDIDQIPSKDLNNEVNKCPICPRTFTEQIDLKYHMHVHGTPPKKLQIRKPLIPTSKSKKLSAYKHPTPKKTFRCTACKLNLFSESQFIRHQTIHVKIPHKSPPKRKTLKTPPKKLLKAALPKKTPNASKAYQCTICKKVFRQHILFVTHKKMHLQFTCPNCKVNFSTKLLLSDHMRKSCVSQSPAKMSLRSHLANSRNSLKCNICNISFSTQISLAQHFQKNHKTMSSSNTVKCITLRKRGAHGGVPPSLKLMNAFDKMKSKS